MSAKDLSYCTVTFHGGSGVCVRERERNGSSASATENTQYRMKSGGHGGQFIKM